MANRGGVKEVSRGEAEDVRVFRMFGNFIVRFLAFVRVRLCSVCSVEIVEKMLETMWVSLGKSWGKVSTVYAKNGFCTYLGKSLHINPHGCGKFSKRFAQGFYGGRTGDLHSFHRSYYYDY